MKDCLMIGYEFTAQKFYPFVTPKEEEFSYDIHTGEKIRVIEKTDEGAYKLLNLNIYAWVIVTENELLSLCGK
jgi:hypothetical protein